MQETPDLQRQDVLGRLVPLAQRAGRAIMEIYGDARAIQVEWKDDKSPLTEADLAADAIIREGLSREWSDVMIVSEERETEARRLQERAIFLVDPLDGTKEFLKRNGEFTVNIALIMDGRPHAGVVHAPALGVTYFGQAGRGAWRRNGDGQGTLLVPDKLRFRAPVRIVGSRSHPSPEMAAFVAQFPEHDLVPVGSSLKFCRVAEGSADIYPRFGPTMEWDTAAGQAVLEAAGGTVHTLQGTTLAYNRADMRNPAFIAAGDRHWRRGLNAITLDQ